MHRIISIAITILIMAGVGAQNVSAFNPITPDEGTSVIEVLPWITWEDDLAWWERGDGAVMRHDNGYLGLFILAVTDSRTVQIIVETDDGHKIAFDCETNPYTYYRQDAVRDYDGFAVIAVIPQDSEFWAFIQTEEIDDVYFNTAHGKGWLTNIHFYADSSKDGVLHHHAASSDWVEWFEVVPDYLGYLLDDSII